MLDKGKNVDFINIWQILSYKIEFKNILLSEIISTMSKNAYYCLTLISWPTITYERKAVLLKATKKMC